MAPKVKPLPGRSLPVMAFGVAILVHGGFVVSQMRQNATHAVESIPIYVVAEIIIGALISLFGSIGRFEPIRVPDAPKPSWDTLHTRHDFILFKGRSTSLCGFIEDRMQLPPNIPAGGGSSSTGESPVSSQNAE
ncbi:unnamed protein product [Amoebophrya sp. A25]|nr:unnamed protein product [Amoebophrya sp. A25]|eukprot:GSA25T00005377001.1